MSATLLVVNGDDGGLHADTDEALARLAGRGLVRGKGGPVKVLGVGDAPKNLTLKVQAVSASARQKIESAGGSFEATK